MNGRTPRLANLDAKQGNYYITEHGVGIVYPGKTTGASWEYVDTASWIHWIQGYLGQAIFNELRRGRVPKTQDGLARITGAVGEAAEAGVLNGGIAENTQLGNAATQNPPEGVQRFEGHRAAAPGVCDLSRAHLPGRRPADPAGLLPDPLHPAPSRKWTSISWSRRNAMPQPDSHRRNRLIINGYEFTDLSDDDPPVEFPTNPALKSKTGKSGRHYLEDTNELGGYGQGQTVPGQRRRGSGARLAGTDPFGQPGHAVLGELLPRPRRTRRRR